MKNAERHTLDYSADADPLVSRFAAQFSLLGGGIAWTLHLLICYIIGEFGCFSGWGHWMISGLSMVSWLLIATTVLTGGLAGVATYVAINAGRKLKWAKGDAAAISAENKAFITRTSVVLNGIFTYIILAQAVPIFFYLRAC